MQRNQNRPTLELDRFLPYLMVNLSTRLSTALADTYQRHYQLSIPEWRVLANLNQSRALTSRDIGHQTCMDKVKVSRAIKRLDAKGWIEKHRHPRDSRSFLICLSRAGQRVVDKLVPEVLKWESALLESLSAGEYRALMQAIVKLNRRLDGDA